MLAILRESGASGKGEQGKRLCLLICLNEPPSGIEWRKGVSCAARARGIAPRGVDALMRLEKTLNPSDATNDREQASTSDAKSVWAVDGIPDKERVRLARAKLQ